MGRVTWDLIKGSKGFYIRTYRKACTALIFSTGLNIFLGLSIYYVYTQFPEPDFYATNGITPPIELTSLDEPNNTSTPLLANDPADVNTMRVIPK